MNGKLFSQKTSAPVSHNFDAESAKTAVTLFSSTRGLFVCYVRRNAEEMREKSFLYVKGLTWAKVGACEEFGSGRRSAWGFGVDVSEVLSAFW